MPDVAVTARPTAVRALACGLATLDVIQTVVRLPSADEKVVATGLLVESGGPAANAATTCTALGVPTRLLTRIGGSALGRLVGADLEAHGVRVLDLAGEADSPAVSTVLVTAATGERAVVSVNATRAAGGGPTDRTLADALEGVVAVLVDGHHLDLAVPLARAARARGVPVLLDGGSWKPGLETLLPHVDVAVLSADLRLPDDGSGSGDAVERVAALGVPVVARSQGPGPIQLLVGGRRSTVPVPPVRVVDTLGAGDVLHGALLAWIAGRGDDDLAIRRGLELAARAASAACAAPGARGWLQDAVALTAVRVALAER
ncbi:MAG TPA: PfkB family carbohydrate kinase [Actinotalea sp.]|nr:PfkB family carbohydrate kinase [Actinotalea sp.]